MFGFSPSPGILSKVSFLQVARRKTINSFPHDKIMDQTKLKAFADDKLNVTKMIVSVFDRVENIVEKEKLLVQAISPFSTIFSKGFFPRLVKRCH